ncbi:hypothetical protein RUM43_007369 [Polyplax serrata]|uniref:Uncharacterized protein n=1 Tax=Polyplax serrata TaxID=468196 RepID=A0AAN8P1T3_POLSC
MTELPVTWSFYWQFSTGEKNNKNSPETSRDGKKRTTTTTATTTTAAEKANTSRANEKEFSIIRLPFSVIFVRVAVVNSKQV